MRPASAAGVPGARLLSGMCAHSIESAVPHTVRAKPPSGRSAHQFPRPADGSNKRVKIIQWRDGGRVVRCVDKCPFYEHEFRKVKEGVPDG